MMDMGVSGGDESLEKRMRLIRFALELGMELAGHEERMILEFDDLNEFSIGGSAAKDKPGLFEGRAIGVIEFVAMTMTLVDDK